MAAESSGGPIGDLQQFPLVQALFGRRSRRFGLGMELPPGPVAFKSRHAPVALDRREQELLVAAGGGVSGWNFGIPYSPSTQDAYANYSLRLTGRSFPTGAGIGTPELFYTDDNGAYLTRLRDVAPTGNRELAEANDLERVLEVCRQSTVTVSGQRLTVPREPPHISEHNVWSANFPGSTLFLPVCDLSEYYICILGMLVQNRALVYDDQAGRPAGNLGPFIRSGLIDESKRAVISLMEQSVLTGVAASLAMMGHNIMLMMQAIGLGGWLYTGINSHSLLGAAAAEGVPGLGFRFQRDSRWAAPNPIGLDGHYESVCPPYNPDMRTAVRKIADQKFAPGGTYDPELPGPFLDNRQVKGSVQPYSEELVECLGEIAQYIYDTYGKFPATAPTVFMNVMVQAQHIDTEFYDTHFDKGAYLDTHANHMARWHDVP